MSRGVVMRLTKKELMDAVNHPMCFGSRLVGKTMFAKMMNELCEYKDTEEDLGIDLNVFIKLLKYGGYMKTASGVEKIRVEEGAIDFKGKLLYVETELPTLRIITFKDYGIEWALTKEELK